MYVLVLLKLFLCIYDCSNVQREKRKKKSNQGRAVQRCVWAAAIIEHTLTRKGVRGRSIIGVRVGARPRAGHWQSGRGDEARERGKNRTRSHFSSLLLLSLSLSLSRPHTRDPTVKECVCASGMRVAGARKSKTFISVCSAKPVQEYQKSNRLVLVPFSR